MDSKLCVKCKIEKPISEFYIKKNGRPHSWCHECKKKDKDEWNVKNKDHVIDYKLKNKERRNIKDAEYRKSHREELRLQSVIYNKKLWEKRKQDRSNPTYKAHRKVYEHNWRQENKEHSRRYFHDYYERYPIKKVIRNLRGRLYKMLKGERSALHMADLTGCSLDFLKVHLESQFQEGMSWLNYGTWHVDHIRPCESFDFSKAEDQKECFLWQNLQPLWGAENISKNAKYNGIDYRYKK
jgi:hypothetical protein